MQRSLSSFLCHKTYDVYFSSFFGFLTSWQYRARMVWITERRMTNAMYLTKRQRNNNYKIHHWLAHQYKNASYRCVDVLHSFSPSCSQVIDFANVVMVSNKLSGTLYQHRRSNEAYSLLFSSTCFCFYTLFLSQQQFDQRDNIAMCNAHHTKAKQFVVAKFYTKNRFRHRQSIKEFQYKMVRNRNGTLRNKIQKFIC